MVRLFFVRGDMHIQNLNRRQRRAAKVYLNRQRKVVPDAWQMIPMHEWPTSSDPSRVELWRSRDFLCQVFAANNGIMRLTVSRAATDNSGNWKEGISWEELQEIKNAVGFQDYDAVEIYPAAKDVVNVANMRHLWVMPDPLPFAWRQKRN